MAPLLGHVGRREIDRDPLGGEREAGGDERRAHALAQFGDRLVGQADDIEDHGAAGNLHLHVDGPGLDALESDGCNADDHDFCSARAKLEQRKEPNRLS